MGRPYSTCRIAHSHISAVVQLPFHFFALTPSRTTHESFEDHRSHLRRTLGKIVLEKKSILIFVICPKEESFMKYLALITTSLLPHFADDNA